jgi:hypothetical protein
MMLKHLNKSTEIMVSTVKLPDFFGLKVSPYETCIFDDLEGSSEVVRVYKDEHSAAEGHRFFCKRYQATTPVEFE